MKIGESQEYIKGIGFRVQGETIIKEDKKTRRQEDKENAKEKAKMNRGI